MHEKLPLGTIGKHMYNDAISIYGAINLFVHINNNIIYFDP